MFESTEIINKIISLNTIDYISIFLMLFFSYRFIVSLSNYIYNPLKKFSKVKQDKLISILIPARNEEKNIKNILNDIKGQTYKNIEVLVYDDNSEDGTLQVLKTFEKEIKNFKIQQGKELPKGWLGKNHACHNLSQNAVGEYFAFIDADVRLNKRMIEKAVWYAEKFDIKLFSIFPKQIMKSTGEKIVVPLMNFILLSLLSLASITFSRYFKSLSAANGQFMFFNSIAYKKYNPHKLMKNKKAEDISIAKFFKAKKEKIRCLANVEDIQCRMYSSYNEAVDGFSKNVISMLTGSYLFAIIFWLNSVFGLVFFAVFNIKLFIIALVMNILSHYFISQTSNSNFIRNILLSPLSILSLGEIIYKSIINKIRGKGKWKGRNIYS